MIDPGFETYRLTIERFVSSIAVDLDLPRDIQIMGQYHAKMLTHTLSAVMRLPADVLRNDQVIAEWPDGLWQTIRKALRLEYNKRQVRATEMLLFPNIVVPPGMKDYRVHFTTRELVIPYEAANEDTY